MRCLSCGILLNVGCSNPICHKMHGQATGKQCDWCSQKAQDAITLLNSALLQYIELQDLMKQDLVSESAHTPEATEQTM